MARGLDQAPSRFRRAADAVRERVRRRLDVAGEAELVLLEETVGPLLAPSFEADPAWRARLKAESLEAFSREHPQ